MKFFKLLAVAAMLAIATSCTLDKTDFEAEIDRDVTEYLEFKEAVSFHNGNYKITVEDLNGNDSSILEVIGNIQGDAPYRSLFKKAFGDERITPERIYKSITQYEYTLISANSKYDKVIRQEEATFSQSEALGYQVFEQKCASCHSTGLFTDQSFRNIGFPINTDSNEAGRARVTGNMDEHMSFRVPSLRNVEYTAPYGSFGQFATIREVLDYFDNGVLVAENLDPVFKNNGNRIPLTEEEKDHLISFMKTLSDLEFTGR